VEAKDVENIFKRVFEEERKRFWVDPETHYQDHEVLGDWRKTVGFVKKSILGAFIAGLVMGVLSVFWVGIKLAMTLKGGTGAP